MKWSEAFVVAVGIVSVGLFFGVAIPSCIQETNKKRLECIKIQPSMSPEACARTINQ